MKSSKAVITGVHGYVPENVVTNFDLEEIVETNDEWIQTRTGIKERRILSEKGKATSFLGVNAVKGLIEKTNLDPKEVDLVICATVTPDMIFPATANIIAYETGMTNAWAYDVMAACSGFLCALTTGAKFIESGTHKKVIVVGADKMSSILDFEDRTTCILFGDGAGAVLLESNEHDPSVGIMDSIIKSDGSGRDMLYQSGGGSLHPASYETVDKRMHSVKQDGRSVFKFAVTNMADVAKEIMDKNELTGETVNWLVPHQANMRIITATADRMDLPIEKVMINIQKYGNTTAGTIPLCLWEWENQLKKGDNIILAAFGGGFTWGSIYLKWGYNS